MDIIRRSLHILRNNISEMMKEGLPPNSLLLQGIQTDAEHVDELILNLYPNRTT